MYNFAQWVKSGLKPNTQLLWLVLGLLICAVLGFLYYQIADGDLIGFTGDDAVYVISSKALAFGEGFRLTHLAANPMQAKYPIGYPLLLAPIWWLIPTFPENQMLIIALTATLSALGLFAAYYYLVARKQCPPVLAILITLLSGTNFYWVYFASAPMSEGPYLLASFLALIVIERALAKPLEQFFWRDMLACVALSALAFHMRQIGVSLALALFIYLCFSKRFYHALIYGALFALITVVPWSIWTTQFHLTPHNIETVHKYAPYGEEFLNNFTNLVYSERLLDTLASIVFRLQEGMFTLIPNFFKVISMFTTNLEENRWVVGTVLLLSTAGAYALFGYFICLLVPAVKKLGTGQQAQVSLAVLYALSYMAVSILWGYSEQISRFLPMILPIAWWYFFKPLWLYVWPVEQSLAGIAATGKRIWVKTLLIICMVVGLLPGWKTIVNIDFVRANHWLDIVGTPLWQDYSQAGNFIDAYLPKQAVLAAEHDGFWGLYLKRKMYHLNNFILGMQTLTSHWSQEKMFAKQLENLEYYGVDYLMLEPAMKNREIMAEESPMDRLSIATYAKRYRLVFVSKNRYIKIYRLLPPVSAH